MFLETLNINGMIIDTLNILPQGKDTKHPYIVMEHLQKDKNQIKGIYVIDMKNKIIDNVELKLVKYLGNLKICCKQGRGSESDIRITDISVSRTHSTISIENN